MNNPGQPAWTENPYRLVSLWEIMELFSGHGLFSSGINLGRVATGRELEAALSGNEEVLESIREFFRRMIGDCQTFGLPVSRAGCEEILEELKKPEPNAPVIRQLVAECDKRLYAELKSHLFLYIPNQDVRLYVLPLNGWENTMAKRGDRAGFDVEEGGKCLALQRNTACVFHMMRLLELALKDISGALNLDLNWEERSWGQILARVKTEIDKRNKSEEAAWKLRREFFEDTYASLVAVKNAWRNTTMHLDKQYDSERAEHIYRMVRDFMEHLYKTLG